MKPFSVRIADVLSATLRGDPAAPNGIDPQPRIDDLLAVLGPRSFGVMLVLFGLPNLLPVPGLPILCGIVIAVIAVQMLLGKRTLVLPRWLGERRMKRADLVRVVERAEPSLRKMEKVMRPRLPFLTSEGMGRPIGFVLLLLAVALMSPIPFFGGIPPGIAVILIGLAITERDGLFLLLGAVATVLALVFTVVLTYAILKPVFRWIALALGLL
jgi:hypothetical protein